MGNSEAKTISRFKTGRLIAAACATTVFASPASADPVTFAQYNEVATTIRNVIFTNNGPGGTGGTSGNLSTQLATGEAVSFTYTSVPSLPAALLGPQNATLTINAGAGVTTTEPATLMFGTYYQPFNNQIVIRFTRATDFIEHNIDYGNILLTNYAEPLKCTWFSGSIPNQHGQRSQSPDCLRQRYFLPVVFLQLPDLRTWVRGRWIPDLFKRGSASRFG